MRAAIESIMIKERIRKSVLRIPELAEDIKQNGLINPITVMELGGDRYQLLAGLRRIRAVQLLGLSEIDVNVVLPANAEAALKIVISENEQREAFTFSEKMDYARLLEDIEKEKAKQRKSIGGKGGFQEDVTDRSHLPQGKSREMVGSKIGMSGTQYDRAKYVAKNAPEEIIDQIDKGERTISGTYDQLRAQEKAAAPLPAGDSSVTEDALPEVNPASASVPPPKAPPKSPAEPFPPKRAADVSEEEQMKHLSAHDREELRRRKEFAALSPEGKIAELERQLFDMRVRAHNAEGDLDTLKYEYGIKVDHKDSIIDSLKRQVADLTEALDKAEKRIAELERGK